MKIRLISLLDALRANYWFLPAILSIAAIALSIVLTTIDARIGPTWLEDIDWLYANKPTGARVVLPTIAGSMITVAGVVFSITIAAVSYASAQYGPRLLSNFLRDRANQFTLGVFIATFLYCLLVIRTVRSADEAQASPNPDQSLHIAGEFVPNIAILTGIVLALCSVSVLIFFVHHVAKSIHISHVIAQIGHDLRSLIDQRFPLNIGDPSPADATQDNARKDIPQELLDNIDQTNDVEQENQNISVVRAACDGYIQMIDEDSLLTTATDNDLIVRFLTRPGAFVFEGSSIMRVWPQDRFDQKIDDDLRACVVIGELRTPVQDMMFLTDELVEIGARALSPGVNDPFTANNCINWLGVAAAEISKRALPESHRHDENGDLRVIANATTFQDFIAESFGKIRPYAAGDLNCTKHLLETIVEIGELVSTTEQRQSLVHEVKLLFETCKTRLKGSELEIAEQCVAETQKAIVQPM